MQINDYSKNDRMSLTFNRRLNYTVNCINDFDLKIELCKKKKFRILPETHTFYIY